MKSTVRKVSNFMGVELGDVEVNKVLKRCDKDDMARNTDFGLT